MTHAFARAALLSSSALLPLGLLSAAAEASERGKYSHELSFTLGSQKIVDNAFEELIADGDEAMRPIGFRAGYGLTKRLSIIGGYQTDLHGTELEIYAPEAEDRAVLTQQLRLHQAQIGVKAQQPIKAWIAPYATLQLSALRGVMRLDDDLNRDDNLNQLTSRGNALGGVGALGIDLRPLKAGPVRLGTHLEVGYGLHSRMVLEAGDDEAQVLDAEGERSTQGELRARGLVVQWGVGLRF